MPGRVMQSHGDLQRRCIVEHCSTQISRNHCAPNRQHPGRPIYTFAGIPCIPGALFATLPAILRRHPFQMTTRSLLQVALLVLVCLGAHSQGQQSRNGRYQSNGRPLEYRWNCNFDENACHFRNQYNLARFSRYYNPRTPFYRQRSALVLDLSALNTRKYPGARLISHYFPAHRKDACLYISYLMVGSAPRAFYVIQQDKENKCIFSDENDVKTPDWRRIQLQLDLSEGDPRFFLEAQYESRRNVDGANPSPPGYIALSTFSFSFGECEGGTSHVNNCFADPNQNINVVKPPEAE